MLSTLNILTDFEGPKEIITKRCPCNIQRFVVVKNENFQEKIAKAVLTSTHNLFFGAKLKNSYTHIKVGFEGVQISRSPTCFPYVI